MRLTPNPRRLQRALTLAATTVLASAAVLIGTGSAAHAVVINATYPVNGTTHINATGGDLTLGPGTLSGSVDTVTGAFTGNVSLPPTTGSFNVLGVVPVTATVELIQAAPTTGTINTQTGAVQATAFITQRLTSLKVAGLPILIGDHCETERPAEIPLSSQSGFNLLLGGTVSGTYTIPDFHNCLLATFLINLTIPGPDNTLSLTLGRATLG
jgi:hypothetical protein